jgi:hypothetical protein
MAVQHSDDGDYFAAVPLETAEDHAATVEVAAGMVPLAFLGPVVTTTATLTRAEARDVAYHVIEASQQITKEENDDGEELP